MSTISQIQDMLPFGPPYEIDGKVYTTLPVIDVDCLVFTQVGPSIPGITPATVLRTVIQISDIEVFRGRNA